MGLFTKKPEEERDPLTKLQETIAMLKIVALELQDTADSMEEQVEKLKEPSGGGIR